MIERSTISAMSDAQVSTWLRKAAALDRSHKEITYEDGIDLVNIIAIHGDKLADALLRAGGHADG